eukprot:scaffold88289_cov64-Phaeocystis_antarctica.AAC.2
MRRQAHEQRNAPDGASQRADHRDASLRECRHRCLKLRLLFCRHLPVVIPAARLLGAHAQQHDAQRRRRGCLQRREAAAHAMQQRRTRTAPRGADSHDRCPVVGREPLGRRR